MKFFLGFLLGLTISSLIFYKKSVPEISPPEDVVTRFKDLSENEARRYAEAKTADEKLTAADALYGKMMLILLADLSLKMQPILQVDPVMVEQTLKETVRIKKSIPSEVSIERSEVVLPIAQDSLKEKLTPEVKLHTAYKNSNHSTSLDRRTRRMLGIYEGSLTHTQGKDIGRIDIVSINIDFIQVKKGELDGSSSVVLSNPQGHEYSRGTSEGGNGSLRLHPDDEDIVFIDASPTSYISLSTTKLNGTYVDQSKIIGDVQLKRK